jgi:hypothetical protein
VLKDWLGHSCGVIRWQLKFCCCFGAEERFRKSKVWFGMEWLFRFIHFCLCLRSAMLVLIVACHFYQTSKYCIVKVGLRKPFESFISYTLLKWQNIVHIHCPHLVLFKLKTIPLQFYSLWFEQFEIRNFEQPELRSTNFGQIYQVNKSDSLNITDHPDQLIWLFLYYRCDSHTNLLCQSAFGRQLRYIISNDPAVLKSSVLIENHLMVKRVRNKSRIFHIEEGYPRHLWPQIKLTKISNC